MLPKAKAPKLRKAVEPKSISGLRDLGLDGKKKFIEALDKSPDVDVYAKLPKTFKIPTPVGDYSRTGN